MRFIRSIVVCASITCSLALAGCSSSGGGDVDEVGTFSDDDIVELGDLVTEDSDKAAAAEQIGDPATLLAEARRQAGVAREDVAAVFKFLKTAASGEPTKQGKTAKGLPYAIWEKPIEGVDVRATLIRTAENRLRYLLQGKKTDGVYVALLTGIFIKKAPKVGGGRFHVNLSNVSDLFTAPQADGSLHFVFANNTADKRGRRILYKNVTRRDKPEAPAVSFGADLVRLVGVGGRSRSVGISDAIANLPGDELFALRVLWKAGEGGRADAALASLADPTKPVVLAKAHECWDAAGLRTAYADNNPKNDMDDANEGDTKSCAGYAEEEVPDDVADAGGVDADPELDALLEDSGAADITLEEAETVEEGP